MYNDFPSAAYDNWKLSDSDLSYQDELDAEELQREEREEAIEDIMLELEDAEDQEPLLIEAAAEFGLGSRRYERVLRELAEEIYDNR